MNEHTAHSYVPHFLEFENRPGYFYVHVIAEKLDLETSRKIAREAAEMLDASGHNKVLALLDLKKRLSFADSFWLISEFPELGLEGRVLAVVDRDPTHTRYDDFADAAANYFEIRRRGFISVEEAEEWLASV